MTAPAFAQPEAGQYKPPQQGTSGEVATLVTTVMHAAMKHHPRSLQAAVGPSELGTPCTRRLAYKILGQDQPNDDRDQWLSTIGTAVHAWQAETFMAENQRLASGPPYRTLDRYLVEHRVHLPAGISGSCDLYDRETGGVIDWKVTSPDNIKKYRRSGPGRQYRTQAHLYGLGMLLAGEHPRYVADVFLPRGGLLSGLHVWSEPFDPSVAADAITRYQATRDALVAVDPELHPERWAMFPTADAHCNWCPFHLPMSADLGKGCPGHRAHPPAK